MNNTNNAKSNTTSDAPLAHVMDPVDGKELEDE